MKKHLIKFCIVAIFLIGKVMAQNEVIQWSAISSGSVIASSQNDAIEVITGQPIVDNISDGSSDILTGFFSNPDAQSSNVTSVDETKPVVVNDYSLNQNFPNPFNPSTTISWQSPVSGYQTLKVYDVIGNEVAILVDEYKEAGRYEVNFDAAKLSSGIYFYKLQAGNFMETKKMILLK